MQWSDGDLWNVTLDLEPGEDFKRAERQLCVIRSSNDRIDIFE